MDPKGDDTRFLCSLVYGPAVCKEKVAFWYQLQQLNQGENLPWVCLGDFNDIMSQTKKQGGRAILSLLSQGLSHFIQSMGFVDLGFVGSKFTWCNKRLGLLIFGTVWIKVSLIYLGVQRSLMLPSLITQSLLRIIHHWFCRYLGWRRVHPRLLNSKVFGQEMRIVCK